MFCPAPLHTYTEPSTFDGEDLSDVLLPGGRRMPVVFKFCYLGDMVSSDCGDACAVDARVEAAGKAFGALRPCVFSSTSVSYTAKARAYEAIVLAILLYGCARAGASRRFCWTDYEHSTHAACARCVVSRVSTHGSITSPPSS